MSAPGDDKTPHLEYAAPRATRRVLKPLKNIGIKQFQKRTGDMMTSGHVRPGSAFDALNQKGKKGAQMAAPVKGKAKVAETGSDENGKNVPPSAEAGVGNEAESVGTGAVVNDAHAGGDQMEIDEGAPQEATNNASTAANPSKTKPTPNIRRINATPGVWGRDWMEKSKNIKTGPFYATTKMTLSVVNGVLAATIHPDAEKQAHETTLQHINAIARKNARAKARDVPTEPKRSAWGDESDEIELDLGDSTASKSTKRTKTAKRPAIKIPTTRKQRLTQEKRKDSVAFSEDESPPNEAEVSDTAAVDTLFTNAAPSTAPTSGFQPWTANAAETETAAPQEGMAHAPRSKRARAISSSDEEDDEKPSGKDKEPEPAKKGTAATRKEGMTTKPVQRNKKMARY